MKKNSFSIKLILSFFIICITILLGSTIANATNNKSGTCCPEPGSICVIPDQVTFFNYYWKPDGSCHF